MKVELEKDDLVSLEGTGGASGFLMAFDARGRDALGAVGIEARAEVPWGGFNHQQLRGWVAAHGGTESLKGVRVPLPELVAFKAAQAMTLWVVHTISQSEAIEGGYLGEVILSATGTAPRALLPDPLGEVRQEFTIPRGTARAYEVAKGEIIQIIDVDGQQCSDFTAFRKDGLDAREEWIIDSTAKRSMIRHAYPGPGLLDKFCDREMRPLLRVVQDTCGRHDTFGLACTARGYEESGFPGHRNCSDNISYAMAPFGVEKRAAWPAINFFWNTWIDPHSHALLTEESHSRPGDYVAMEAMEDLACVSTACPDDLDPINGWNPTDVHVRIYRTGAPIRRAVAYRVKEDAPMTISHESAFHPRTADLTHAFAPARDLWLPTHFPATGTAGEYWACREKVTLQDMSSLRKYDIVGPDAERLLQRALSRDISRLAEWRGGYAIMCDETGAVIDDGTLFRMGGDLFRWCCGTEESLRHLASLADAENLNVRVHDMNSALVNLALQEAEVSRCAQRAHLHAAPCADFGTGKVVRRHDCAP